MPQADAGTMRHRIEEARQAGSLTDRQAGALQRVLAERAEYGNYTGGDQTDGDRNRAAEDLFRSLDESGHMRAERAEAAMGLYGMLRGGKGGGRPGKMPGMPAGQSPRGVPKPDIVLTGKKGNGGTFTDKGFAEWWEKSGRGLQEKRAKDPNYKVAPEESFIWKNLGEGEKKYKTNEDGLHFKYDRGGGGRHGAEIEVFRKRGKWGEHEGAIDPLTGQWLTEPDPRTGEPRRKVKKGRRIYLGLNDDPGNAFV